MDSKLFDNQNVILRDDLIETIKSGSKVSIAAACFSIYAYEALKEQLESVEEFRFLFTEPTFLKSAEKKEKREFYIPRLTRENSLYGTQFEVRLRNQMNQKAIAKECAEWIRQKGTFKSILEPRPVNKAIIIQEAQEGTASKKASNSSSPIEQSKISSPIEQSKTSSPIQSSSTSSHAQGGSLTVPGISGMGGVNLSTPQGPDIIAYNPVDEFTALELGCEHHGPMYKCINRLDTNMSREYLRFFTMCWQDKSIVEDVTDVILNNITTAYQENSPEFIYFLTLYHVFSEFLENISEDHIPNEATGFKNSKIWNTLYDFQKDAVLGIINKLEKYNGCILADSVGLGKTFTALAVVKYYENRNKSVLVLCPKKLGDNWNTYKDNYVNNIIAEDRLNYDVLFHTDLARKSGHSNGLDLSRLNWGNYDLVVIDESHNFRNGSLNSNDKGGNRYEHLLNQVIRAGVKTKVLMLSATPVNNRFLDLRNQLQLAYEGDASNINDKLDITKSIETVFNMAQREFAKWSKLPRPDRTTERLLQSLDFDFFSVLDSVTIARSRRHIEKYYDTSVIGKFPTRLKPISIRPALTAMAGTITYNEISEQLFSLNLSIYTPTDYILGSRIDKYLVSKEPGEVGLTQRGREYGIRKLMATSLLKRLESSVHAFLMTVRKIKDYIGSTISAIERFEAHERVQLTMQDATAMDFDLEDENTGIFTVGRKVLIDLDDMDVITWKGHLLDDYKILTHLEAEIIKISPKHDGKLQELLKLISHKIENPINGNNKKVLIFSAFADTAEYLYTHVSTYMQEHYGLHTALVTGSSTHGKTTIPKFKGDLNHILTAFSPISKDKAALMPNEPHEIDILIATDCISEGQNLQDCDYLINYDIHWNPVRIIQRFGRIDRIGSRNQAIQLVNFWPDMNLDEYINLKQRVEARMKALVLAATGDDNPIDNNEEGDLEYRREQLKKLQEEVVDIEDMSTGISIMDLGLNEFRLDLLEYIKDHPDLEQKPRGMHAVVPSTEDLPPGVMFVLKNINEDVNIDNQNHIHPFYMVYISRSGEVLCDYLRPKSTLDNMRLLCRGKSEPIQEVCSIFNQETNDGKNMSHVSKLLSEAIDSIIHRKHESDIDSLFSPGGTSALVADVHGLEDFELISFVVIQ